MRASEVIRLVGRLLAASVVCTALAAMTAAQTVTVATLHTFTGITSVPYDGANPAAPLVQGLDGKFYGTTLAGGTAAYLPFCDIYLYGCGTFFSIDTSGNLSILYSFCNATCSDGYKPLSLVEGPWGTFYGTTDNTAFKITPEGTDTTFYTFLPMSSCCVSPIWMIQGWDGAFHGTSYGPIGGANNGTVFRLTPGGKLTISHVFCQQSCQDGFAPQGLIQATDGNLYGVTFAGVNSYIDQTAGTVFRIGSSGFKTIYDFCSQANCADGAQPNGLVEGNDGNFYGTTQEGGANGFGTFFKITPSGVLTTLYNFCSMESCVDGGNPFPIILASDGNFYGSTQLMGTFFQITPSGSFTFLYTNGYGPTGLLVQGTDGAFYGTAQGGINGGAVFRVDLGLGPFVRPVVPFAKVGATVTILGTDLHGATAVNFNGTPATFKVVSATAIRTTVPVGASSGPITVVTPAGSLTGNPTFTVVP